MIRKYRYGTPFDTEALTEKIETTKGVLPYGEVSQEEGFVFTYIIFQRRCKSSLTVLNSP